MVTPKIVNKSLNNNKKTVITSTHKTNRNEVSNKNNTVNNPPNETTNFMFDNNDELPNLDLTSIDPPVQNIETLKKNEIPKPMLKVNETIRQETVDNAKMSKTRPVIKFYKYGKIAKQVVSELSENNSRYCESCAKNKTKESVTNSTNTTPQRVRQNNITTQTDNFEFFISIHNSKYAEREIFNRVYDLIETEILDEILNNYFKNVFKTQKDVKIEEKKTNLTKSSIVIQKIIPKTPEKSSNLDVSMADTSCNNLDTSVLNPNYKNSNKKDMKLFNDNFQDLREKAYDLNSSISGKKLPNFRSDKRKPLEFVANKLNSSTFLNESYTSIPSRPTTLKLKPPNPNESKKSLEKTSFSPVDKELIIEDTPTKSQPDNDESNEHLKELNVTLSKSANRMELVNSRLLFDTSIVRYDNDTSHIEKTETSKPTGENCNETILFESNNPTLPTLILTTSENQQDRKGQSAQSDFAKSDEKIDESTIITDTVKLPESDDQIEPTRILTVKSESEEMPKMLRNTQKRRQDISELNPQLQNSSFILNSLNVTNYNDDGNIVAPYMLNTSVSSFMYDKNNENINKQPPMANDILGVSFMNPNDTTFSMTNTSVVSRRSEYMPKKSVDLNSSKYIESQLNNRRSDLNESRIVTDSMNRFKNRLIQIKIS